MAVTSNSSIPNFIIHRAVLLDGREQLSQPNAENTTLTLPAACGRDKVSTSTTRIPEALRRVTAILSAPQLKQALTKARDLFDFCRTSFTWSRHIPRPPSFKLFEQTKKMYQNRNERLQWLPRMLMFQAAMGLGEANEPFNHIFSLSIEPTDPTIRQTLYYRHSYKKDSEAKYTISCSSMNHYTSREQEVNPIAPLSRKSTGISSSFYYTLQPGFLKPYKTFAANEIIPELDPERCPNYVKQSPLNRAEEIDPLIEDLQSKDLQGRIRFILNCFLLDPHSKKLYLITVQPFWTPTAPVKRTLFIKG